MKYVAGGYYNVVVKSAMSAKLVSPAKLDIIVRKGQYIEVRMLNQTNAKKMKLSLGLEKSVSFDIVPNDKEVHAYRAELSGAKALKGTIDQFRLELGGGKAVTGIIRVDSVRILEKAK